MRTCLDGLFLAIPALKGYNSLDYFDLELIPFVRGTEAGPGPGAGGGTGGERQALRQRVHEGGHVLLAPGPGHGPGGSDPGLHLYRTYHRGGRRVHDAHPIDYGTNTVYVDVVALDEPYILEPMRELPAEYATHIEVPEGSVFVMGDNRNNSTDGRSPSIGVVDERCILGRALFVLLPFQDAGVVESISQPRE